MSRPLRVLAFALVGLLGACERPTEVIDPTITIVAVDGAQSQTATVGTVVPVKPSVRVTDSRGKPIHLARVLFAVTRGGGIVAPNAVLTDADGIAQVGSWTLGTTAGPQEVTSLVQSATTDTRVAFAAIATPGAPATMVASATALTLASAGTATIVPTFLDAYANPVAPPTAPVFTSANSSVATVSADGFVTGVSAGTTTITVSAATFQLTVTVRVGSPTPTVSAASQSLSGEPYSVAISPAGVVYVTRYASSGMARLDLPSDVISNTFAVQDTPFDVAFAPNGTEAYVSSLTSNRVVVVTTATDAVDTLSTPQAVGLRLKATSDGKSLLMLGTDTYYRTDLLTLQTTSRIHGGTQFYGLAIHPNDSVAYLASTGGELRELLLADLTTSRSLALNGNHKGVAVSPDGSRIFVTDEGGPLRVVNRATFTVEASVDVGREAWDVAITPDGRYLYLTRPARGEILILDAVTYALHRTFSATTPRRIAFSADGLTAVVADQSGAVIIIR